MRCHRAGTIEESCKMGSNCKKTSDAALKRRDNSEKMKATSKNSIQCAKSSDGYVEMSDVNPPMKKRKPVFQSLKRGWVGVRRLKVLRVSFK